jgi:uncharacterized protein
VTISIAKTNYAQAFLLKTINETLLISRTLPAQNAGIVGLVYTPEKYRRNGYATNHVQRLIEYILQKGFIYCGLFTDKANPISNHIYKKIGYEPITEYLDIGYK